MTLPYKPGVILNWLATVVDIFFRCEALFVFDSFPTVHYLNRSNLLNDSVKGLSDRDGE